MNASQVIEKLTNEALENSLSEFNYTSEILFDGDLIFCRIVVADGRVSSVRRHLRKSFKLNGKVISIEKLKNHLGQ